jgi:DNA polymerase delta subunit 1
VTSKVGALAAFTKRSATCIGCKTVLKRENEAVCDYCRNKEPILYMRETKKLAELEEKFARLWVECQRCQDSLHEDVLCTK